MKFISTNTFQRLKKSIKIVPANTTRSVKSTADNNSSFWSMRLMAYLFISLVLTVAFFSSLSLSRAYAQDAIAQDNFTSMESVAGCDCCVKDANFAYIVDNGVMVVNKGSAKEPVYREVPSYRLVFTYSDAKLDTIDGSTVIDAYQDFLNSQGYAPWDKYSYNISIVDFKQPVRPLSTKFWFYRCENLTEINFIERLDTSSTTNMLGMFCMCLKLENLDLSSFNTSKVTDMSNMFSYCSSLKSLDLSSFDTSNVVDMQLLFGLCEKLEMINLSSFDTSKVTSMTCMFYLCSKLTSLDLSTFSISSLKDSCYMFGHDKKLQTIKVSDLWGFVQDCNTVEMFYECTSLVGGKGTTFNSNKTDGAYARIDGGTERPGYLTGA